MGHMITLAEAARTARISAETLKRIAPTTGLRLVQVSERRIVIAESDFQSWLNARALPQSSSRD
jgi:hypothetical protein